ncbi:MAG: SsgA family sporulation/cell division regulator [Corynebacteriales bacterium]|nr:SsgA family sporulation/cell division regulator [Mycobacteriales bacterium]
MMNCRPTGVQVPLELRLVVPEENATPIQASLAYKPNDPYAVHITFHSDAPGATDVSWSFSRELLTEGLYRQTGMGDVKVWPWAGRSQQALGMALSSPDGYALFEITRSAVELFLSRSYALVPAGAEADFFDMEIELGILWSKPDADAR